MIQVDIRSPLGRDLASKWDVKGVPFFILISDLGEEMLRTRGEPPAYDDVLRSLGQDS